jgi:hypothetical protein
MGIGIMLLVVELGLVLSSIDARILLRRQDFQNLVTTTNCCTDKMSNAGAALVGEPS